MALRSFYRGQNVCHLYCRSLHLTERGFLTKFHLFLAPNVVILQRAEQIPELVCAQHWPPFVFPTLLNLRLKDFDQLQIILWNLCTTKAQKGNLNDTLA